MATWHDDWNVHYGIPRGGIELPVEGTSDPGPWAAEIARQRLGPDAAAEPVEALAALLAAAVADSRGRRPLLACFFCPDPALGELARIEVSSYEPDETYPELTVRQVGDWLAAPTARSVRPAEVGYPDLPIGPAVRISHQFVDEDAGRQADGLGTIMQTCAYAVRPAEIGSVLVMMVSWRALAYSDRLFDLTDRLADKLRLLRK